MNTRVLDEGKTVKWNSISIILCFITILILTICVFSPIIRVESIAHSMWGGAPLDYNYRQFIYFTGQRLIISVSGETGEILEDSWIQWNNDRNKQFTSANTVLLSIAYILILIGSILWIIFETHKRLDTKKKFTRKLCVLSILSIVGSITGVTSCIYLLLIDFTPYESYLDARMQLGYYLSFILFCLYFILGLLNIKRIKSLKEKIDFESLKINTTILRERMKKNKNTISTSFFVLGFNLIGLVLLLFFPLMKLKYMEFSESDYYYTEYIRIERIFFSGFIRQTRINTIIDLYVDYVLDRSNYSWWRYTYIVNPESRWSNFPTVTTILIISAVIISILISIALFYLATHKLSKIRYNCVPYLLASFFIVAGVIGIIGLSFIIPYKTFLNIEGSQPFQFTFSWYFGFILFIVNTLIGIGIFFGTSHKGYKNAKKITLWGFGMNEGDTTNEN